VGSCHLLGDHRPHKTVDANLGFLTPLPSSRGPRRPTTLDPPSSSTRHPCIPECGADGRRTAARRPLSCGTPMPGATTPRAGANAVFERWKGGFTSSWASGAARPRPHGGKGANTPPSLQLRGKGGLDGDDAASLACGDIVGRHWPAHPAPLLLDMLLCYGLEERERRIQHLLHHRPRVTLLSRTPTPKP